MAAAAWGAALLMANPSASAEMSATELAKLAQNPVGNLISVPFQNNTNLNFGPDKGTQNILNIQPVIPISVDEDWNIITRTILPVIWKPVARTGHAGATSGIGDIQLSAFLSPAKPGQLDLGRRARSRSCRRTATRSSATRTGASDRRSWCCTSSKGDPWVYGVLVEQRLVALAATSKAAPYSTGLIQPFVNYNFAGRLVPRPARRSSRRTGRPTATTLDGADWWRGLARSSRSGTRQ